MSARVVANAAELGAAERAEIFDLRARGCTCEEIVGELRIGFGVEVSWQLVAGLTRGRLIDRPGRVVMADRPPTLSALRRRLKGPELPLTQPVDATVRPERET